MADVIGLSDVSSPDTGKGSQLKTGNLKRSYKMAKECKRGQVYDAKIKDCRPYTKSEKKQIKMEGRVAAGEGAGYGAITGAGASTRMKGKPAGKGAVAGAIIGALYGRYKGRKKAKKSVKAQNK
jgi:hypothetical protein